MKNLVITSGLNDDFAMYIYNDVQEVKGIVHIVHGMCEYIKRYEDFANFLNKQGYIVVGIDVFGHGLTVNKQWMTQHGSTNFFDDTKGYFGKDAYKRIVSGLEECYRLTKEVYDVDYYVLGHSMGSFITKYWMANMSVEVDKVILSGTGFKDQLLNVGAFAAKLLGRVQGDKVPSMPLYKMTNGKFAKSIKNRKTPVDWLSHDQQVCEDYITDLNCRFIFTHNGYYEMLTGIKDIFKAKSVLYHNPLFLIVGAEDIVGHYGKDIMLNKAYYEKLGLEVEYKIYPKMRHEILNELGKKEVYDDILKFISK